MNQISVDQEPADAGIGARLRAERQRLGYAQADFGAAVGVSKTTQFNYEAGDRTPDARYLNRAASLGVDLTLVVTGRKDDSGTDRYVQVPSLVARDGQGSPTLGEDGAAYEISLEPSGLSLGRAWLAERQLTGSQLGAITVRGSSMEPVLVDGDQVLIDRHDARPRSGFVYALRQGEELLVRYCQVLPGGALRITCANPSFAAYDVDLSTSTDVEVIGRVVASVHAW